MTIVIHLQPGESIKDALIRACLITKPTADQSTITIPPDVHVVGEQFRKARINIGKPTIIPFLPSEP